MRLYATVCGRYHWIPEMPIMIMIIIKIIKMILKMTLRMRFFALCDRIKCAKLVQNPAVFCSKDVQNLSEISFLSSDGCLVVMLSGQRESTLFISFSLSTVHSETKRLFL